MEGESVVLDDGVRDGLNVTDGVAVVDAVVDGLSVMVVVGLVVVDTVAEGEALLVGDGEGSIEAVEDGGADWVRGRHMNFVSINYILLVFYISSVMQ